MSDNDVFDQTTKQNVSFLKAEADYHKQQHITVKGKQLFIL